MEPAESDTVAGQGVDIRGCNIPPVATDIPESQVVCHDKNDVGLLGIFTQYSAPGKDD
jgi:hypothetical protein